MDNSAPEKPIFDIKARTLKFSVLIIQLVSLLPKNAAGFAIASQLVRSGTSIGANIEEAQDAASKKDFTHGMVIALKEARETDYWLKVVGQSNLINDKILSVALKEVHELVKILTVIVKKSKLKKI